MRSEFTSPRFESKDAHDFYFEQQVASYPGLKDLMHEVSARTQSHD